MKPVNVFVSLGMSVENLTPLPLLFNACTSSVQVALHIIGIPPFTCKIPWRGLLSYFPRTNLVESPSAVIITCYIFWIVRSMLISGSFGILTRFETKLEPEFTIISWQELASLLHKTVGLLIKWAMLRNIFYSPLDKLI